MIEFWQMLLHMPVDDFILLVGAIVIWAHLVAFAVLLGGRR